MKTIHGKGIPLVKFKNEEIIDSLQSGCIYFNNIEVFRRIEKDTDDDRVGDYIDSLLHIQEGEIIIPELDVHEELHDEALYTACSNDYGYCFYCFDVDDNICDFSGEQKSNMCEMGEWALIITDFYEFANRIYHKATEN